MQIFQTHFKLITYRLRLCSLINSCFISGAFKQLLRLYTACNERWMVHWNCLEGDDWSLTLKENNGLVVTEGWDLEGGDLTESQIKLLCSEVRSFMIGTLQWILLGRSYGDRWNERAYGRCGVKHVCTEIGWKTGVASTALKACHGWEDDIKMNLNFKKMGEFA
jgi:hypothetical protein